MTDDSNVTVTEEHVSTAAELMMATFVRQLRMKLRTMSKKQLANACVNLALELHTLQQQNAEKKAAAPVSNA